MFTSLQVRPRLGFKLLRSSADFAALNFGGLAAYTSLGLKLTFNRGLAFLLWRFTFTPRRGDEWQFELAM